MSERNAAADLAICAARTPGPVKWQKFGKQYYLTGQYGMRPIIFATVPIEKEGYMDEIHISNRDAERDLLIPLDPDHPDSKFVEMAWEALPYWIRRAQEAEAVLNDIYPTLAGHLIGLRQLGEEKAAAEWEKVVKRVYEIVKGVAK